MLASDFADRTDRNKIQELLQNIGDLKSDIAENRKHVFRMYDIFCRIYSLRLQLTEGIDAFPLNYNDEMPSEFQVAEKADVIRIVLNALPIPDENTPGSKLSNTAAILILLRNSLR